MNGLIGKKWIFYGVLLHSSVVIKTHFKQLGHILKTVIPRHSNLIVFDRQ